MKNDYRFIAFIFACLTIIGCVHEIIKVEHKTSYKLLPKCHKINAVIEINPLPLFNEIVAVERNLLDSIPKEYHVLLEKYKDSHFQLEKLYITAYEELQADRARNIEIIKCKENTIKILTDNGENNNDTKKSK